MPQSTSSTSKSKDWAVIGARLREQASMTYIPSCCKPNVIKRRKEGSASISRIVDGGYGRSSSISTPFSAIISDSEASENTLIDRRKREFQLKFFKPDYLIC